MRFEKGHKRTPIGKDHPNYSHGLYGTPLYKKWLGMKRRCQNKNDTAYDRYGGRGIKVCDRWQEFQNFYDDMSPSYKEGLSLERLENNFGYCLINCEWIALEDQAKNRRNVYRIDWKGKTYTAKNFGELLGLKPTTVTYRLRHGWSIKRIATTPV